MEKTNKFKLVDGEFSASESGKVLFTLINSKINYHNLEALSIQERFNRNPVHSNQRVEELQQATKAISKMINFASDNGFILKIESYIEITLIQPELEHPHSSDSSSAFSL